MEKEYYYVEKHSSLQTFLYRNQGENLNIIKNIVNGFEKDQDENYSFSINQLFDDDNVDWEKASCYSGLLKIVEKIEYFTELEQRINWHLFSLHQSIEEHHFLTQLATQVLKINFFHK